MEKQKEVNETDPGHLSNFTFIFAAILKKTNDGTPDSEIRVSRQSLDVWV